MKISRTQAATVDCLRSTPCACRRPQPLDCSGLKVSVSSNLFASGWGLLNPVAKVLHKVAVGPGVDWQARAIIRDQLMTEEEKVAAKEAMKKEVQEQVQKEVQEGMENFMCKALDAALNVAHG